MLFQDLRTIYRKNRDRVYEANRDFWHNFIYFFKKGIANETILVLGDSHVKVFHHWRLKLQFPFKLFHIRRVAGATISGLQNPHSKTQAGDKFRQSLTSKKYDSRIIVILGEVDTGFVIWYRAQKYHTTVETMLDQTIDRYQNFLKEAQHYARLIVISTPLPTIKDGETWGEVANLRQEIEATQRERTDLTLKFNAMMQNFCEENNIIYVSLDKESLGEDGLIADYLKNKNPSDHHYEQGNYAKLLNTKLKGIL